MSLRKQTIKARSPPKPGRKRPARQAPVRITTPPALSLVVGIGASAGGLNAFKGFFAHMPPDSGMAFVLVQHLDPSHKSMLVDLLGRQTAMPVVEAEDGMPAVANRVHVIPPDATLIIANGTLRLTRPAPSRENRRPIDTFFSSLAEDQNENAVCIVLSGTGSDGTLGLRTIKEHGGLILAQADFDSTAMSGMPHSAAATGLVDHVMVVEEMPATLLAHRQHLNKVAGLKDADGNRNDAAEHLGAIAALLRAGTGHDFSQYKPNTLVRRIQRRMQVLRIDAVPEFMERLRKDPLQVDLLFREFLIGVTHFFRDPKAYQALQATAMAKLLEDRQPDDQIRIWIPGCATGEEVYSLAILLREAMERQNVTLRVQLFGTDIDEAAVATARTARYRKTMIGVSPERLSRWFAENRDHFSPIKEIREMCVFSTHSVVKDPPFSKLDLISCRNLLIYLDTDLQDRVLRTFHYALRPGGHLFLGQSEGVTRSGKLFAMVDKKHRIFLRREVLAASLPDFPRGVLMPAAHPGPTAPGAIPPAPDRIDLYVRRVMEKHSPVHVVIDKNHDILRFSGGEVGRFLEPSSGTASLNLFGILRKALRPAVRAAVLKVYRAGEAMVTDTVKMRVDGHRRTVRLFVEPIPEAGTEAGLCVVAFQEVATADSTEAAGTSAGMDQVDLQALEQELQTTKAQLRTTIDELETSNEEMKSANEEFQSVNEELQSSNEELETAKEEMQSVNEELQTINAEMNGKNDLLTHLNSDLKNLLDSTQIATIFLDNQLRIKTFTPGMTELFHLRDSDRGRPITEIVTRLNYADLRRDVTMVLGSFHTVEHEVQIPDDNIVLLMRILPYRTVDNIIDGVVITFTDITERKRHEEAQSRLAAIIESSHDAVIGHSVDGLITSWNAGAEKIFGYMAAEVIGKPLAILLPEGQKDEIPDILSRLNRGDRIKHFEVDRIRKDGRRIDVSLNLSAILDGEGKMIAAATIAREFTERRQAEDHKNHLMAELDHRMKNTLMIITSLVGQTLKSSPSPQAFAAEIAGRIQALSRVHSLLNRADWDTAELSDLVEGELAPYRSGDNIVIAGRNEIVLTGKATLTLAMALHELAVNAAKYGALSVAGGLVEVNWGVTGDGDDRWLKIEWIESGGPRVAPPTRVGFGTQLIERIVTYELEADVQREFLEEGVRCNIRFPLTQKNGRFRPDRRNGE